MKNENLTELINNHWFDQFQSGLRARFLANKMDYKTMLAHAFIYLRDGTFDYHKDWFEKLQQL